MGTLKAFGFSKKEILTQYIVYSLTATLIGSFIGVILGVFVFPKVIFSVYANLYAIPKMIYADYLSVILIGVLISIICIVGPTILVMIRILKESTIKLLRPVAPLVGKKILLEHIPIWHKINFSNKITIRNTSTLLSLF
jgi:putative ABC transport system permease protein